MQKGNREEHLKSNPIFLGILTLRNKTLQLSVTISIFALAKKESKEPANTTATRETPWEPDSTENPEISCT